MQSILQYQFMQNALIAGIAVGVLCSVLSIFVVLRKMAFIGQGIAHAAFGGIAFALLFNLDIFITTNIFCIIVAVLIGIISKSGKLSEDSSIGLFLTTSMALGAILLKLRQEYTSEVFSYLFGNILAVSRQDVVKVVVLGVIVLGFIAVFIRQLEFFTFDEEMALVSGVPVNFLYYMLLILLSIVIVVSIQVVGVVLVSALLVLPATIALLIGNRFIPVMIISVLAGVFSTMSGLTVSYYTRLPSGAVIVMVLFALFLTAMTYHKYIKKKN